MDDMRTMMINYLQSMLDNYILNRNKYGMDDLIVKSKFRDMFACMSMVEALIHEPVTFNNEGKIIIGF